MSETVGKDQPEKLASKVTTEQMASLGGDFVESLYFGRNIEDEGSDIYSSTLSILEAFGKKNIKELSDEKLRELGRNFDSALVTELDSVLINYKDLYAASDWELERQLKDLSKITKKIECKIKTVTENESEGSEKMKFLFSVYKKLLWAEGVERVLAGGMIAVATYYAAEKEISVPSAIKITQEHLEKAFYKELEGLPSTEQSEYVFNREEIIKMQNDALKLSMMAAAMQQREVEVPPQDYRPISGEATRKPRERERMFLSPEEEKLVEEIFAERDSNNEIIRTNWIDPATGKVYEDIPEKILNYFCMDKASEENKRLYFALLSSAIEKKVRERLKSGEDPTMLGEEVRKRASEIIKSHYAVSAFEDTRYQYASLAARTIIASHIGTMACGELGWGWNYEVAAWEELEDVEKEYFEKCAVQFSELTPRQQDAFNRRKNAEEAEGKKWPQVTKFVVLRVKEKGSIYTTTDAPSPFYPEDYVTEYQARAESASEMYPGLADSFRRMSRYHRPDWRPPIEEYLSNNPYVKGLTEELLGGTYSQKELRPGVKYGEVDYRFKNYINKYKRAWPTWVQIDGKPYAIPYFYPTTWLSLNFWRSLGVEVIYEEDEKLGTKEIVNTKDQKTVQAQSIWEKFGEDLELSDVNFLKYPEHATDWDSVNRVQLARGLVLLFLSSQFSGEGQQAFGNFVARPLNINTLKDWDKRMGRLGVRGEDVVPGITGMLTFAPIAVKLIAEKTEIGTLGSEAKTKGEKRTTYLKYREAIAELKNNAAYLAKSKGLSKTALTNYNKTYAMIIDFYSKIMVDWAIKSVKQTVQDRAEIIRAAESDLEEVCRQNGIDIKL